MSKGNGIGGLQVDTAVQLTYYTLSRQNSHFVSRVIYGG